MTTKALEALLQKFQVVVFVGGFSQSGSTTCEGSHGTEDVDVLVLALHLCRISAAMSTDKGKLKTNQRISKRYINITYFFTYYTIYLIYYINHVFFPKKWQNFMVRYLRGATARVALVAASEARPLLLLTRNDSLEPIHKGLWGFARTVRLEELSVVIFFMSSTGNSGGVSFCRCESVNLFF